MKTITFSGSNSSKSINQQLVTYAASLVENSEVINLTSYNIPMYSIDIEEKTGIPNEVKLLSEKLATADNFIISVSEHNGNISAFFKNILDWLSRNNRNFLENKNTIILSTSPGKGGGKSALEITKKTLPYFKATIIATLSIGSFYDNFKDGKLIGKELDKDLKNIISKLK